MDFLDQFENLFFLPESFKRIRDLFLKVSNSETNVVFGFCWKTDLVGLTNDFPYQLRDTIRAASRVVPLAKFSEAETNALLDKLSDEIHAKLRKDLRFFLSEFSQGYPWLLKKLCAHVRAQRDSGISQAEIANGLLNVEQLFQEDLSGLSAQEQDTLHRIAKLSPVPVSDLGDELKPAVIQNLIDRRLVVRIGVKLDIYWDIFRDYLNTGKVPAQEQYIPRLGPRPIFRACRLLGHAQHRVQLSELPNKLKLSSQSVYNVVHEMRMLALAQFDDDGGISLRIAAGSDKEFQRAFSQHVGDKLKRNRIVQTILNALKSEEELHLDDLAILLKDKCPYISASQNTWEDYAETLCAWIEAGDLAMWDNRRKMLSAQPGHEVAGRQLAAHRKRGGIPVLQVHYTPVETLAIAFGRFLLQRKFAWPEMKPSTRQKALTVLEDFGFITRPDGQLRLTKELLRFAEPNADPPRVLGEAARQMSSFREFLDLLEQTKEHKCSLLQLGFQLRRRLDADWSTGTAKTAAKIFLDWARHTKQAPGVFAKPLRRLKKSGSPEQAVLF